MISKTPQPPYYAVIFTSQRADDDKNYGIMAAKLEELAEKQLGFLGMESARSPEGFGITVSYWKNPESIIAWKKNAAHLEAQRQGKEKWYENFKVRVCLVERDY